MDTSIKDIWSSTLKVIKGEMPNISFNTFIMQIKPLYFKGEIFFIGVENDFYREIIDTRHLPLIENAVRQVMENELIKVIMVKSEDDIISNTQTSSPDQVTSPTYYTNLNKKYDFDTFVIGESNRFAHAACAAVAEAPSERYNPLFIYGGVGLGKTHLMHAMGNYVVDQNPNKRVVYISCETFTNEFIDAITNKTNQAFRQKYREVDMLLIDDIQFLAGKEGTQEEFFHTFNTLHQANKQIVVSSDRPPKEIQKLEERLRTRFEWGLITDITAPNLETRIAILRKKAEKLNKDIPNETLVYIADNIDSNIRELEGALTKVIAYSNLTGTNASEDLARDALKDLIGKKEIIVITPDLIKECTGKYYNVTVEEINSKKRTKTIAYARQVSMYLTKELTELSYPKVGESFGGRDHSTVIHGCDKIKKEIEENTDVRNLIMRIRKEIEQV
jgi:chromosomal replication initiator protein